MQVKSSVDTPAEIVGVGQWIKRTDCTYFWVNFGVVLVEKITNYICRSCKCILIQVINHREEKDI